MTVMSASRPSPRPYYVLLSVFPFLAVIVRMYPSPPSRSSVLEKDRKCMDTRTEACMQEWVTLKKLDFVVKDWSPHGLAVRGSALSNSQLPRLDRMRADISVRVAARLQ